MASAASSRAHGDRRVGVWTLVCAVDEGGRATRPTLVARRLAQRLGDELVLVHAVTPPPVVYAGRIPSRAVLPPDRRRLADAAERALAELARDCGVEAARRVGVVGPAAQAVLDVAERERAELIVVGSHRRGLFASALLGSVSEEIADGTDIPVLVVPSSGPLRPLDPTDRIVCGVDAGGPARRAVSVGSELALRLDAELLLVTAARSEADGRRLVEELVEEEGLPAGTPFRVMPGRPAAALEQFAAAVDAALIVVGRRGGVFMDMLRGSVSATLRMHARRPLVLA